MTEQSLSEELEERLDSFGANEPHEMINRVPRIAIENLAEAGTDGYRVSMILWLLDERSVKGSDVDETTIHKSDICELADMSIDELDSVISPLVRGGIVKVMPCLNPDEHESGTHGQRVSLTQYGHEFLYMLNVPGSEIDTVELIRDELDDLESN